MNPYTDSELGTFCLLQMDIEVFHRSKNSQPSPYCSVKIIFMGVGITEIDEQPVTKQLSDMPIVALDYFGTLSLICPHHIPVLFRIELAGESSGVHEVTKHHGELTAFRF